MPFDWTTSIANRLASSRPAAAADAIFGGQPVLQFAPFPIALNPDLYANPFSGSNPKGSYKTLYAFRVLADPVPYFGPDYFPSETSTEMTYGEIVNGASALGDADYAQAVLESAAERFRSSFFIGETPYPSRWRPVYATPSDWYDVEQSGRFIDVDLDLSSAETAHHPYTVPGAGRTGEQLSWRIGADEASAVSVPLGTGTRLQSLHLKYLEVHLTREWLNPAVFSMDGWFLKGQPAGWCSTGKSDVNDGVLPLLTSSMLIGMDTSVTADWSEADRNLLAGANRYLALGPFVLQTGARPVHYGASLDSRSAVMIAAPKTLFVVGWLSALVPLSPRRESSSPVLPVSIASFKATPAEGSRIGHPVTLSWQTSSAVTLEIDQNVGVVCAEAGCLTGEVIVHPTARTVYTLTATGRESRQTRSVTVFPLPQGWLKTTAAAPWHTRDRPVLMAFAQQLWFMAGGTSASTNDIYASVDGVSWRTVTTSAPWSLRSYAGGVVFAAAGVERMWLMGGAGKSGAPLNDVWAVMNADGTAWELVSSGAAWAGRSRFGCIAYQGRIWVIGGWDGSSGFNDVWSSTDGKTWTRVTAAASWSPRWNFAMAEFRGRLWIFGGQTGANDDDLTDEIWSSADGQQWRRESPPPWGLRSFANAEVFGDRLYLMGGAMSRNLACADLWRMTVAIESGNETFKWAQLPTQPMEDCAAMASAKLAGGAWLAGGWRAPDDVPGPNQSVWLYAPGST
jgi:hypothetical protein